VNRGLGLALAVASCGSPPPRVELPATKPPIVVDVGHVDVTNDLAVRSEEVTFKAGDRSIPGTVVEPATGIWPGVVIMAGSGPTDRDWNSPMLPSKNGSGRLLAEALAKKGAVVLRFDKAAIGGNTMPGDRVTLDTYVDEGRAALAFLRTRHEVDANHLFVAGHSEGGLHAIRVAIGEGGRVAGLLLLSTPGRPMGEMIVDQIGRQLAAAMSPELAKAQSTKIRDAVRDLVDGKPVDPMAVSSLPPIQQLFTGFVAHAKLVGDLFGFDPIAALAKLNVPVFVFNGLKDVQVDPQLDAASLERGVRAAGHDVTMFLAPDADHVLKHEVRSLAELRADLLATQNGYNAADRVLDTTTLSAIANWLGKLSSSRS
jgi:hypothetical protein